MSLAAASLQQSSEAGALDTGTVLGAGEKLPHRMLENADFLKKSKCFVWNVLVFRWKAGGFPRVTLGITSCGPLSWGPGQAGSLGTALPTQTPVAGLGGAG